MLRSLILAACVSLLAAPALAQSNTEGQRLVGLGRRAFDMGNYSVAAQLLWDATMADEAVRDSAPLQTLRARAVMRSGRPENAVRIFDQIGGTAQEYADALYWRGEALMMMTEPGEAADSFREALVFDPNHQQAQMRLSGLPAGITAPVAVEAPLVDAAPVETIGVERTAPARERTAADNAPPPAPAPTQQNTSAQTNTGPTSLRPAQMPAAAQPAVPPATMPAPDEPDTPPATMPDVDVPAPPPEAPPDDSAEAPSELEQGRAAFAAGEYADAAALMWRATLADERVRADRAVQTVRGRAVMLSGRPDTAVDVFDAVAEGASGAELAEARYWRGEAEMMLGREDAARNSFRQALAALPGHPEAAQRLAALDPAPAPAPAPAQVQTAAAAPGPGPSLTPVATAAAAVIPAADPAPAPQAATPEEPDMAEIAAAADRFRAEAEARREEGDDAGEAFALSELYLTQMATEAEIARYREVTSETVSQDIGRDAQIAQLAGFVHHDLAIALYRSIERADAVEGRNLAILRTNLATAQLESGDAEGALETAELALETDDEYPNAWAVRSLARQESGDLGGALEDAIQAYDRGVTAPQVLALLNAAGLAVGVQSTQPSLIEAPTLRGAAD